MRLSCIEYCFVPSSAFASEIPTNVAIQDLLAQDAELLQYDVHSIVTLQTSPLSPPSWIRGIRLSFSLSIRLGVTTIRTRIGRTWKRGLPMTLCGLCPNLPNCPASFELSIWRRRLCHPLCISMRRYVLPSCGRPQRYPFRLPFGGSHRYSRHAISPSLPNYLRR